MRRLAPLALLAALSASVVAGCGGVSLDPVARAAEKTADAGSFRFTLSVSVGIDLSGLGAALGGAATTTGGTGQDVEITGNGAWDANTRRLQLTAGVGGESFDAILDLSAGAPAVYMKPPAGQGRLPAGKTWVKLDLAEAAKQGGLDLGALTSAQVDPKQLVEMLKRAGASTKIGEDQVGGVPTTHYRVQVDLKKELAGQAKEQQQAGDQALKLIGQTTLPVDVWVDDAGLVRRLAAELGGKDALFSLKAALDLSDYGGDVQVGLPPADEVETASTSFAPPTPVAPPTTTG